MAATNFAALTDEEYAVWSRQFWREARNKTFIMAFAGSGPGSMVQRVIELSETKDGARAVLTLLHDSLGDGVVGDNQLLGNESPLTSDETVIQIDQWREAHRNFGAMSDQKSIVKFRENAKYSLSYVASRVMDELAFLTMSGVSYAYHTNGAARVGSQLPLLSYAGDVTAPSANRHYQWDAINGLSAVDHSQLVVADTPSWKMLVELKAQAVNSYIRPIRTDDGVEVYNVFMTPTGMSKLKQDADFLAAWREAEKRGEGNPIFKGTAHGGKKGIMIDGLNILEYRNVYNTQGLTTTNKWGTSGTVDGQRVLLCGAQALAFADIKRPSWNEEELDYGNVLGISIGKMFGMLKPKFQSIYTQTAEDFGVLCVDTAI